MPSDSSTPAAALARRSFIAPLWHTFSFLLLLGFLAILDCATRARSSQPTAPHDAPLRAYLLPIFYEWGIAAWAWRGVLFKDGQLRELTGGRWTSWHNLALDVAIAIPFWGVWELTARLVYLAVTRVQTPTTSYHPPSGFVEVFFWILLSVSAGVCEEIVYRGYFQQQFWAATGSVAPAVLLQVCFLGWSTPTRAGKT